MKTHCKRGHEYTPENTIWNPQPGGKRTRKCRACANASNSANRDREADKSARQRARIPGLRERIAKLQAELLSLEGITAVPQEVPHPDETVNFNGRLVTWAEIDAAVRKRNAALSRPQSP